MCLEGWSHTPPLPVVSPVRLSCLAIALVSQIGKWVIIVCLIKVVVVLNTMMYFSTSLHCFCHIVSMQRWALMRLGSGDFLCDLKTEDGMSELCHRYTRLLFTGRNQLAGLPPTLSSWSSYCVPGSFRSWACRPENCLVNNMGFLVLRESEEESRLSARTLVGIRILLFLKDSWHWDQIRRVIDQGAFVLNRAWTITAKLTGTPETSCFISDP